MPAGAIAPVAHKTTTRTQSMQRSLLAAALVACGISCAFANIGIPPADDCGLPPLLRQGTALDDAIRAAVRAPDGSLVLAGYENGDNHVENDWPVGAVRGFVEKRHADGSLAWRRTIDTTGIDIVEAIALDGDGGVVVAGRTSGALPGFASGGQMDAFVATFAADGTPRDALQVGDERPQRPAGVAVLPSGDIVVAGWDDVFVEGRAVIDHENGFIGRLRRDDGALSIAWWQRSRSAAPDRVTALVAAGGRSEHVVFATHTSASPARGGGAHVARLDAAGQRVWARTLSPVAWNQATALASTPEGRVYVAGADNTGFAGPNDGHTDGFVGELAARTGKVLWLRTLGSEHPAWLTGLATGPDGSVHVAASRTPAADYERDTQRQQLIGAAFGANGAPLWQWRTPLSDRVSFAQELSLVAGACTGEVLVAGGVAGAIPGTDDHGGLDAVLAAPDVLDVLLGGDPPQGE
jgi:outer membrane protein assembly factor BamB